MLSNWTNWEDSSIYCFIEFLSDLYPLQCVVIELNHLTERGIAIPCRHEGNSILCRIRWETFEAPIGSEFIELTLLLERIPRAVRRIVLLLPVTYFASTLWSAILLPFVSRHSITILFLLPWIHLSTPWRLNSSDTVDDLVHLSHPSSYHHPW